MLNLQYCAKWIIQPITRVYPQKTPIATKLHVIHQCVCMPHRTLDAKDNEQNRTHLPPQKCPRSCNSLQYEINGEKWEILWENHKCIYLESIWVAMNWISSPNHSDLWLDMESDFTACLVLGPYDVRSPMTTAPNTVAVGRSWNSANVSYPDCKPNTNQPT